MSSRKKNLPSPDERKGEAFWRELNSADWDGKSCSQVFEEFVDVMFCILSAGKVEYKGRAMFQKDRDRKIGVFQRTMLLLGEEMEREPYRDLLGRVYQDVAGAAGKRALSAVYTPDAICKMTAGMGITIMPLNVSATLQRSPRLIVAPTIATREYTIINPLFTLEPTKNSIHLVPYKPHPRIVENAKQHIAIAVTTDTQPPYVLVKPLMVSSAPAATPY